MRSSTRHKKLLLAGAAVLYGAAFFLLACYFYMEFGGSYWLTPGSRVAVLLLSCLLMYPGGILLSRSTDIARDTDIAQSTDIVRATGIAQSTDIARTTGVAQSTDIARRDRPLKANLLLWMLLYLVLLATLTLFDLHFARSGLRFVAWDQERLSNYLRHSLNLIPFATILPYVLGFFQGEVSGYVFVVNVFGNIAALMPLGFFLPLLFKRQQRWRVFIPTVAGIVAAIELLQFASLSGSCDIDDLILNVSGACLMFALLEKTPLRRLVRRIFLLEGTGGYKF